MYHFSDKLYRLCHVCKKKKPKNGWVVMISNRKECYCSNSCFFTRYRISSFN